MTALDAGHVEWKFCDVARFSAGLSDRDACEAGREDLAQLRTGRRLKGLPNHRVLTGTRSHIGKDLGIEMINCKKR